DAPMSAEHAGVEGAVGSGLRRKAGGPWPRATEELDDQLNIIHWSTGIIDNLSSQVGRTALDQKILAQSLAIRHGNVRALANQTIGGQRLVVGAILTFCRKNPQRISALRIAGAVSLVSETQVAATNRQTGHGVG